MTGRPRYSAIAFSAEGKLVFSTHNFPPFSYLKGTQVKGPFVDIINAICGEIGYKCDYKFMPNRRSKLTLKVGSVNGNFPLGWNKGRDKWLWFTIPLMKSEYGFFARSTSQLMYTKLEDIQGLRIGVFGPSNTSNSLKAIREKMKKEGLKPIRIDMHPNADGTGLKKVVVGRYPLYYANKDVGFHLINELRISKLKYIGMHTKYFIFAAFAKKHNDKRIIDKFNRTAIDLSNREVILKLLEQYGIAPGQWDKNTLKKYNIVIGSDKNY